MAATNSGAFPPDPGKVGLLTVSGKTQNGHVLEAYSSTVSKGQPFSSCVLELDTSIVRNFDVKTLQSKIRRLSTKAKDLRKKKRYDDLGLLLSQPFFVPSSQCPPQDTSMDLLINNYQVVRDIHDKQVQEQKENKTLKRKLEHQEDIVSNYNCLFNHSCKQVTQINADLIASKNNVKKLKHENRHIQGIASHSSSTSKLWESKYSNLKEQHEELKQEEEKLKAKISKYKTRNVTKRLNSRDKTIQLLREENSKLNKIITNDNSAIKIVELKTENRNLQKQVQNIQNAEKQAQLFLGESAEEIQNLKKEIISLQDKLHTVELENDTLRDSEKIVRTFENGKFTNPVRQTLMTLMTEHKVSLRQVNRVIEVVLRNLAGMEISHLPSAGIRSQLLTEARHLSQTQVTKALMDTPSDGATGACLHQDGTSRLHKHYQGFQITTCTGETLTMGLTEVGGQDSSTLYDSFEDNLKELASTTTPTEDNVQQTVNKLLGKLKNTMSDQCATNLPFNRKLQEARSDALPLVVENWDALSPETQQEASRMGNYFCKMHVIVNFATECEKSLQVFEQSVTDGKNPHSFRSESGAVRLARTISKAFTSHGCEKSGVTSHYETWIKDQDKKSHLISFRGERFNHLFCVSAATYHHWKDVKTFLETWPQPNELLKSILFDVNETVYIAGLRALGIVDKVITGPLWRIIERSDNILDLNKHLHQLQITLDAWRNDGSDLLKGEPLFHPDVAEINKDSIFDSLVEVTDDPILETFTQLALELLCSGLLLILERQAADQLPGGKYWNAADNVKLASDHVPTTNTCSERDFAQLDILLRTKPASSTIALESYIMWSNNKTSSWLESLCEEEKNDMIDKARRAGPSLREQFKLKKAKIFEKKLQLLRIRQQQKESKEEKERASKVKLTNKIAELGGVWASAMDIDTYLDKTRKLDLKKTALVTQLQFHKNVLHSKGPKEIFQQTVHGKQYTVSQMKENLLEVLRLNNNTISVDDDQRNTLVYNELEVVKDKVTTSKQRITQTLINARNKRINQQQLSVLPELLTAPEKLIGKNISQKCREEGEKDTTWFEAKVVSIFKKTTNIIKTEYNLVYSHDPNEQWHFPLLKDLEAGDLVLLDNL